MAQLTLEDVRRELGMVPLPSGEGGFLTQTLLNEHSSSIYYLMGPADFSALHRLAIPEVWYFHAGSPAQMLLLFPDGHAEEPVLGTAIHEGQRPQVVVPAEVWQGTSTLGEWTLVGTNMAPPYSEDIFELGEADELVSRYPAVEKRVQQLARA